ncbi:MAG: hypothetical protein LPK19_17150, partial [Hymenobacteraceae bacterium]|nr:hypothetical protein [Hymenobacteraceae bacterium]MDX5397981.1 hypothetical protein [Hymenobacteraceae bacterium]MDX5514053.1 hypothetical protein [Hymenobacteraceae bacterium]
MKTITRILVYTVLLCISVTITTTTNGQIPFPAQSSSSCSPGSNSATAADIKYTVNGSNTPKGLMSVNGNVGYDATVEYTFNVTNAPGRYSLVSYVYNEQENYYQVYDYESILFPISNSNRLKIKTPPCNFIILLVKGCIKDHIAGAAPTSQANFGAEVSAYYNPNIADSYAHYEDNRIACTICEEFDDASNPKVMFRLIATIPIPGSEPAQSNLIFSVINLTNDFLIGDIRLTTPNALPPKNNLPYQFRYNYQIDNTDPNSLHAIFDQRNNHNNHTYDTLQSELIIYPVFDSDLYPDPLNIEICAELDGKHPEPGDTPGELVCADFSSDCGIQQDECSQYENGFLVELEPFASEPGNITPLEFKVTNTTSTPITSVTFTTNNYVTQNIITNPTAAVFVYDITNSTITPGPVPGNPAPSAEVLDFTENPFTGGYADAYDIFEFDMATSQFLSNGAEVFVTVETETGDTTIFRFEAGLCGSIVTLPVELTFFKGQLMSDRTVKLNWQTASEKDNDRFEIERSTNGKDFVAIGMLKGNGSTNTLTDYTFTDAEPMRGLNYYRLKQVDFDGTSEYSKVIALSSEHEGELTAKLVPNPCVDKDCAVMLYNVAENTVIELRDMTGRLVYSRTIDSSQQ